MYLGIDLGTSAVKVILVDERQIVIAAKSLPLAISRPKSGYSEQDPNAWIESTFAAIDALKASHPQEVSRVRGIGLSGHMHGATLLGADHKPLRPCILWNDGRSSLECRELESRWPTLRQITGNKAMPGFTAPKLLWVARHEPEIFSHTKLVLLPKAYLRLVMTGEAIEDMSDAAGTLWLDVAKRDWSDEGLAAAGLSREHMPRLAEGSETGGRLRNDLAQRWGMIIAPLIAGGAGDNAAGAVGIGAVNPGSAFLSLGTSGVLWVTTDRFAPNTSRAVHAFCHAVPDRWHQMGVILSAASCLSWISGVLNMSESDLLAPLGASPLQPSPVSFLPYLSGERTPHDDADVRGLLSGFGHETNRDHIVQAVLEGVAFAFADCRDALADAGTIINEVDAIGGGTRSRFWLSVLANVLGFPIHRLEEGETGGAFGAARLARLAVTGEPVNEVCLAPRRIETIAPDRALSAQYAERLAQWRKLYCRPSS